MEKVIKKIPKQPDVTTVQFRPRKMDEIWKGLVLSKKVIPRTLESFSKKYTSFNASKQMTTARNEILERLGDVDPALCPDYKLLMRNKRDREEDAPTAPVNENAVMMEGNHDDE